LLVLRFALRNRFWAARFARLRSSFIQAGFAISSMQFLQRRIFLLLVRNITTRKKKSMTTKTPSQRIALLEAKLARAKADERKQRTRRLIEVGAMLEPLGERVAALTAEQRKYFISRVLANWEALMGTRGNNQHQGDA
jgi:hypothetical protein